MHAKQCRSGMSFDPFDDFAVCSVTVVRPVVPTTGRNHTKALCLFDEICSTSMGLGIRRELSDVSWQRATRTSCSVQSGYPLATVCGHVY